jgi:hypothetical protein
MLSPEFHPAIQRLEQALAGLRLGLESWLDELSVSLHDDAAFITSLRRWEEHLTIIKLYLHRAEARLLHFVSAVPPPPASDESLPKPQSPPSLELIWRQRLEHYFSHHHLPSAYRRIDSVLDHDDEAVTADILTDLAALAALSQRTIDALAAIPEKSAHSQLEERAFYHVIGPWRTHGHAALCDVLRWLSETLREEEEW